MSKSDNEALIALTPPNIKIGADKEWQDEELRRLDEALVELQFQTKAARSLKITEMDDRNFAQMISIFPKSGMKHALNLHTKIPDISMLILSYLSSSDFDPDKPLIRVIEAIDILENKYKALILQEFFMNKGGDKLSLLQYTSSSLLVERAELFAEKARQEEELQIIAEAALDEAILQEMTQAMLAHERQKDAAENYDAFVHNQYQCMNVIGDW